MFLLNLFKILILFVLLGCQSCGLWQGKSIETPAPFVVEELKSEIPFSTREPENYQTEIVVSRPGSELEEKIFAAKSGANRLLVFNYQQNRETAVLQTSANQNYTIARAQKIFVENLPDSGAQRETLNDFLVAELLNRRRAGAFETLGAENNLTKYRVRLDESEKSEIIIFVDEKINLPIRQEFYSINNEASQLTLTIELRNFNFQPDASIFELPKDYRKVAAKEFVDIHRVRTK